MESSCELHSVDFWDCLRHLYIRTALPERWEGGRTQYFVIGLQCTFWIFSNFRCFSLYIFPAKTANANHCHAWVVHSNGFCWWQPHRFFSLLCFFILNRQLGFLPSHSTFFLDIFRISWRPIVRSIKANNLIMFSHYYCKKTISPRPRCAPLL